MKLILGINTPSASLDYVEYAKVAVHTAREVGYEPVMLIDGENLSASADLAVGIGCTAMPCQSRFLPEMVKSLRHDELLIARGAMLRLEIPFLFDDEYVLYTDLDVIVRKHVEWPKVKSWGMVHENWAGGRFNSGVSIMNLPSLRDSAAEFDKFSRWIINHNQLASGCWDQGLINRFYCDEIAVLPRECNWRPYWGRNDKANILHFHGPKPLDTQERLEREYPAWLRPAYFEEARMEWHQIHGSLA